MSHYLFTYQLLFYKRWLLALVKLCDEFLLIFFKKMDLMENYELLAQVLVKNSMKFNEFKFLSIFSRDIKRCL